MCNLNAAGKASRVASEDSTPDANYWAGEINAAWAERQARPALVLGGAYLGLAFVRSLGRRGVPAFVLDSRAYEVAMHTRHGRGIVMPDVDSEAKRWVEFLGRVGPKLDCRSVLFVAGDAHLDALLAGRETLAGYYDFALAESHVLDLLRDKRRQYQWLMERGVQVPRTLMPTTRDEAVADAASIGYPCVAKPAVSHRWPFRATAKVKVLRSGDEAGAAFDAMNEAGCGCVMQETIGGGDDRLYGALCCFSRLGEPLATMTKRKLRQYPEGFGNGSVQVSLDLPELAARSERILGSLGCRGFMSIEYKHDPADGRMKLIEINPRLVSGLQMAIDSGLDLPWLGYCDIVGAAAGELRAPRHGTIFMNEAWELRRVLSKRTAWAWADAALMAMRARSFAVWSVRDPGPLWSLAKRAWRGELQRF